MMTDFKAIPGLKIIKLSQTPCFELKTNFSQQFHQNTGKRFVAIGEGFCYMWVVVSKMVSCSVYNCMGKGKSLFTFPENAVLLSEWKRNTKWENFKPGPRAALLQVNTLREESRINAIN